MVVQDNMRKKRMIMFLSLRIEELQRKPSILTTIMTAEVMVLLQWEECPEQEVEVALATIPEAALLLRGTIEAHLQVTWEVLHQATMPLDQTMLDHLLGIQRERTTTSLKDLDSILEIANSEWTSSVTILSRARAILRIKLRGTTEIDPKSEIRLLLN